MFNNFATNKNTKPRKYTLIHIFRFIISLKVPAYPVNIRPVPISGTSPISTDKERIWKWQFQFFLMKYSLSLTALAWFTN